MNTLLKTFANTLTAIQTGKLKTFIPLLSIFTMKGKPLTLDLHYQFAPMFNVIYPPEQTWMTGRQVGKTWQLALSLAIRSGFIPFYDILHIEPRDLQRTRYHTTILRPLLESSPISNMIIKHAEASKVLLKQFCNGSFMYLGTAYANADALRGLSGCAQIVVDELADVDFEFLPIIQEVMSANIRYGYSIYAGTPTTTDTTCGIIWSKSSQAEWIIKCPHCNKLNIPNPLKDLYNMLGPEGLLCCKCGRYVGPEHGRWIHAIALRQMTFPGYHISQTIHPLHLIKDPVTGEHRKWYALLHKVENYGKLKLYNEVFGWPYDESINPLTLKDLLDSCHDISVQHVGLVNNYSRDYRCLAIGVDWDGGGTQSLSFTAACVAGLRNDSNRIDILYCKRWNKYTTPDEQANLLMRWIEILNPDIFAHDNTGAGFLRMEIMKQKGLLTTLTTPIPFTYVRPSTGDIIKLHKSQRLTDYYNYTLDKSRSLAILIQSIKACAVRMPKFKADDLLCCQRDFLALKLDPRPSIGNLTVVLIGRKPGVPDDFAHAVNFACSAIWDKFHIYPVLGKKYDVSTLAQLYDNFSPRSEFEDFQRVINMRPSMINVGEDEL